METTVAGQGLVFLLKDSKRLSYDPKGKYEHNYLILGKQPNEKLGQWQAMTITSMRGKDIDVEVPILLGNNMISYVVPYNIHSFIDSDFSSANAKFQGVLNNTDIISSYEFIQLLIDIYADCQGFGLVDHNNVVERYNTYCENFWDKYKDYPEYRERHQTPLNNSDAKPRQVRVHPAAAKHKPIRHPYTVEKFDAGKALNDAINGGVTQTTFIPDSTGNLQLDDDDANESSSELVYTDKEEFKNTISIPSNILLDASSETSDGNLGPSHLETILLHSSRFTKQWTNDNLLKWNEITSSHTYTECKPYIKISNPSFYTRNKSVYEELVNRGLKCIEKRKGNLDVFGMSTSVEKWSNKDLMSLITVYYDMSLDEFCKKFKCTRGYATSKMYTVRKECKDRNLEISHLPKRHTNVSSSQQDKKIPALL